MTLNHIFNLVAGLFVVGFGVHTIATKRANYCSDDFEEDTWWYGWRAVALGIIELLTGLAFMASGLGVPLFDGL